MTDAPERIWACPLGEEWEESGDWDLGPDGQGAECEYIRADLCQPQWRTIDSAPKDGTVILLYVGIFGHDYASAFWNDDYWDIGSRDAADARDKWNFEFGSPTHWMPLPEPPK